MFKKLVYFITKTAVSRALVNFQKEINTWEEQGIPLTYHNINAELNLWIKQFRGEGNGN